MFGSDQSEGLDFVEEYQEAEEVLVEYMFGDPENGWECEEFKETDLIYKSSNEV